MGELQPLISDLALILVLASVVTILFKRLNQPLVLGYIVAGFISSPHFQFMPSVTRHGPTSASSSSCSLWVWSSASKRY